MEKKQKSNPCEPESDTSFATIIRKETGHPKRTSPVDIIRIYMKWISTLGAVFLSPAMLVFSLKKTFTLSNFFIFLLAFRICRSLCWDATLLRLRILADFWRSYPRRLIRVLDTGNGAKRCRVQRLPSWRFTAHWMLAISERLIYFVERKLFVQNSNSNLAVGVSKIHQNS